MIGRARFVKSLETKDKSTAKRRASLLQMQWLGEVEEARKRPEGFSIGDRDARYWAKALREAPEADRETIRGHINSIAQDMKHDALWKADIQDERDEDDAEIVPGVEEAMRFHKVATGQSVPFGDHVEAYLSSMDATPKTVSMRRKILGDIGTEFPAIADIKRKAIQSWINRQSAEGNAPKTIARNKSAFQMYWQYLQFNDIVHEDAPTPFHRIKIPKINNKERYRKERKEFKAEEVVQLLYVAQSKGDFTLADLIELGMWTGARIEELCSLSKSNVDLCRGSIKITDAKTLAGIRTIPIHSKLEPTVRRLIRESNDGFVLCGLTLNRYGDRSNALGKRFGRLKKSQQFDSTFVFHSIRKTVSTLLKESGVSIHVSTDIIKHKDTTETYGNYAAVSSLAVMKEAIEKIDYPLMKKKPASD